MKASPSSRSRPRRRSFQAAQAHSSSRRYLSVEHALAAHEAQQRQQPAVTRRRLAADLGREIGRRRGDRLGGALHRGRTGWLGVGIRIGAAAGPVTISVAMATTVLIVDDHPSFRASARMLLESEGFEVVGEAEDGLSGDRGGARPAPGPRPARRAAARHRRHRGGRAPDRNGTAPAIVLTSSRDLDDLGSLGGAGARLHSQVGAVRRRTGGTPLTQPAPCALGAGRGGPGAGSRGGGAGPHERHRRNARRLDRRHAVHRLELHRGRPVRLGAPARQPRGDADGGHGVRLAAGGLGLSDLPLAFTFGQLLGALYFAVGDPPAARLPDGRLQSRRPSG